LKWAQSKEGYFATDSGKQFWITNPKTKALVHTWRSQEMAILVGAKTVLADNPKLNTRLIEGKDPLRVIINTKEQLNPKSQVFEDELPTLLFSYEKMELTSPKEWIPLNQEQDVIPQILNCLYTKDINSVIVEGGAFTLQQFIDLGLWDEARILTGKNNLEEGILAPKIEGKIMGEFKFMGDHVNILKQHQ
jgi:diaminohydroxyphosphoribosylaminopyrimidine deaminase/5-amino-6-(5-phosphoribosylamino)uracil reductase